MAKARSPVARRPAPPARRAEAARGHGAAPARDPATIVTWAQGGARGALPHRALARARFGAIADRIEVLAGERARAACRAFDARAFAVHDLVAFADPSPSPSTVLHEVAHVVQQRALDAPRPRFATHALTVAAPGHRAEREVSAAVRDPAAPLTRAPLAVYRETDGTSDSRDVKDAEYAQRFFRFVMDTKFKPTEWTTGKEIFGQRHGEDFSPRYAFSSSDPFKRDDYFEAMRLLTPQVYGPGQIETAGSDLAKARDDVQFTQTGLKIKGNTFVITTVREPDVAGAVLPAQGSYFYALVAGPGPIERVQEIAAKGAVKAEPAQIIADYGKIIDGIRAANAGKEPTLAPAFALLQTDINATVAGAAGNTRAQLFDTASKYRERLFKAVSETYPLEQIDPLHDQVIASGAFFQPYNGLKGGLFQKWVGEHVKSSLAIDVSKEPIFGKELAGNWVKSDLLLKVRRGDGKIKVDGKNILAEVKAYTKGPEDDTRLQMQDYALIIRKQVHGYLSREPENPGAPYTFEGVYYFFSNADIAKAWIIDLEKYLPGLYVVKLPAGFDATPTPEATLEALRKSIKALKAASVPAKDLDVLAKRIDAAVAAPATDDATKKARADETEAIRLDLIAAVAAAYADLDLLYTRVLGSTKIFEAPFLAMIGQVFEKWIATHDAGRDLTHAATPLRGQLTQVRPLWGDKFSAKSARFAAARKGTGDVGVIDDRFVFDMSADPALDPARPGAEDKLEMADMKYLFTTAGVNAYFQSKGGTSNTVVARSFKKAEYRFKDVAAATPWSHPVTAELPNLAFLVPDPKAPKSVTTTVAANPVFELAIKDADQLDQTFTKNDVKAQPGVELEAIKLRLQQQRKPDIESGSITLRLADNPVVSGDKAVDKPISPSTDAAAAGKQKIYGRIENKIGGLKSKLDSFLKRVQTDARLIANGVEATIRVIAGPSGLPKLNLDDASIVVVLGPAAGASHVSVKGSVGLSHQSGKIKGALAIGYKGGLTITGSVHVQNVITGLDPVDATVAYTAASGDTPESLLFKVARAKYTRRFKGVTLSGTATDLVYDTKAEAFSGNATLEGDFGAFGKGSGSASIANNELANAVINYTSPTLAYPKTNPKLTGTLTGGVTYKEGKFGGTIGGTAQLAFAPLKKLSPDGKPLGLAVDVKLDELGAFSGSIRTTSTIALGKNFRIPSVTLTMLPSGDIEGDLSLEVVGIKYLESASATIHVSKAGVEVRQFDVTVGIEKKPDAKFWGSLRARYTPAEGFTITAKANVKVKDGLVVAGTLIYAAKTGTLDGSLTTEEPISLLKVGKDWDLFDFKKQIELVSFYHIIGIYLDLGAKVTFSLNFNVSLTPTVWLKGLDLSTFAYDEISAQLVIDGKLAAELKVAPYLGLGLFIISTKLLRGGGGIKIPISARLGVDAGTTLWARYKNGDLQGGAQLSVVIKFGIAGDVAPYAEFVVLDGAWAPRWDGDSLKHFTILPERELFRWTTDFGKPLPKDPTAAPMGPNPAALPTTNAATVKEASASPSVPSPVKADKEAAAPKDPPGTMAKDGKDEDFSMASLKAQLKNQPVYRKLEAMLDAAGEIWNKVTEGWETIKRFFTGWLKLARDALDAAAEILRGIARDGLFKTIQNFLRKRMSPEVYDIVEPLLSALTASADNFASLIYGLLDRPLPDSLEGFLVWAWDIITGLVGGSWSSVEQIAAGMRTMFQRGQAAAVHYVDFLVRRGKLGVKWSSYSFKTPLGTFFRHTIADTFKIHIGGLSLSADPKPGTSEINEGVGIAMPLYLALWAIGATPTSGADYWVDGGG